MIFNFTREEKEILYEIEKRNLEERAQAAGSDKSGLQISVRIQGEQEFQKAVIKFEKERFSKLKGNPAQILADAQDTAEAGIHYAADYFANEIYLASKEHWQALKKKKPDLKPEEAEADNYLIYLSNKPGSGAGLDVRQNISNWDWDTFRGRSEQILDKVNFSKDNAREWIKEVAIPEHVKALKRKKEGETLDNFIDDLLDRLPFVVYVGEPEGVGDPGTASAETTGKKKKDNLPVVSGKISEKTYYPIDPANKEIWQYNYKSLMRETESGQLAYNFPITTIPESDTGPAAGITYSIDFNRLGNIEISKELNHFDKAVYIACATLYRSGYSNLSIQQIHSQMGSERRANRNDYGKIYESLKKMSNAWIEIENSSETGYDEPAEGLRYEADAYEKTERLSYEGPLLMAEFLKEANASGNITNFAVHLTREPVLISYAQSKREITTVKTRYLKTKLYFTENNLKLRDYMILSILRMKRGTQNKKLTFQTILKNVSKNPGKKNELDRLKDKVISLIEDFTESGFIKGGRLTKDKKAIEIIL